MLPPSILLVEDNPDDEFLCLDAFRRGEFNADINVARDGEEAVQALSGSHRVPNLILLDLKLPKIGGHEVLRRIRSEQRTRHVPVVVLTSSAESVDLAAAYENGANSYIVKPVAFEDFLSVVKTLGLYWLFFNRAPV